MRLGASLVRAAYRGEVVPARVRWWLAAAGMVDSARVVARGLEGELEDPRGVVSALVARMFDRRWEVLRGANGSWPDARRGVLLIVCFQMGQLGVVGRWSATNPKGRHDLAKGTVVTRRRARSRSWPSRRPRRPSSVEGAQDRAAGREPHGPGRHPAAERSEGRTGCGAQAPRVPVGRTRRWMNLTSCDQRAFAPPTRSPIDRVPLPSRRT